MSESACPCHLQGRDCYAVMGNPIEHSKSPLIHRMFADQTGQSMQYDALQVEPEEFTQAVASFLIAGGKGMNITVPFKQDAWEIADETSERAQRAAAVNTLMIRDDGTLLGDNTDGIGLVRDLGENLGVNPCGRHILIVGAGGAARGAVAPLLQQQPASLTIVNRTVSRAEELADHFDDLCHINTRGFTDLRGRHFDIIINATAAGLDNKVPPLPEGLIRADDVCYDMMYGSRPTAFVRYALQQGAKRAYDGLGMLVEQAAESFLIWRGVHPQTRPVIEALRKL